MRSSIRDLFGQLAEPFTAEALFDQLSDTVFFVKDREGRYVCVNDTLVARCRRTGKSDLLGRHPSEVFGDYLGGDYEAQDHAVLQSGEQLVDKLEMHVYEPHELGWCLTSKFPLVGEEGRIVGLVGISRDLKSPSTAGIEHAQIAAALAHAESHLAEPPSVVELAEKAQLSIYQLDRRMKQIFGLSTGQWLLKTRIDHASRQLLTTDTPIASIALDCGYKDQSAFTRQFRRTTGRTPSAFRKTGDRLLFHHL